MMARGTRRFRDLDPWETQKLSLIATIIRFSHVAVDKLEVEQMERQLATQTRTFPFRMLHRHEGGFPSAVSHEQVQ